MAKVVTSIPAKNSGRQSDPKWDRWLDGQLWQLERGVDVGAKSSVYSVVFAAASSRGIPRSRLKIALRGKYIFVQVLPETASEGPPQPWAISDAVITKQ